MAKLIESVTTLVKTPERPLSYAVIEVPVDAYEVGYQTPFGTLESLPLARQFCEANDLIPELNIEVVLVAVNRESGAYRVLSA
jgi:hypothetical protein